MIPERVQKCSQGLRLVTANLDPHATRKGGRVARNLDTLGPGR